MRNMLNVMQYQSQFCNKSWKITNLFNVHTYLFDTLLQLSLVCHRMLLTMTCSRNCTSSSSLASALLYSCISATRLSAVWLTTFNLYGAETTFRSSIAFLFLPHRRICGQKFSWRMKEVEQVHGLAGDQVIQCAWMERVWWNFWAFVWSVGFCSAATMSLFVAGKKRSSNKANPTSSCDRYQRWDESFLLVANEIAAWMLE